MDSKVSRVFRNAFSKENIPSEKRGSATLRFRCRSRSAAGIPLSRSMTKIQASPAPFSNTRCITVRRNAVEYEFSYHLSHLAPGCGEEQSASRNTVIPARGVFLHNVEKPNAEGYGSACLTAIGYKPRMKGMWLRSPGMGVRLALGTVARSFNRNIHCQRWIERNRYRGPERRLDSAGRARWPRVNRAPIPIVITWHFPNCYLQAGGFADSEPKARPDAGSFRKELRRGGGRITPRSGTMLAKSPCTLTSITLHCERARWRSKNRCSPRLLPPYVLDAVSANLAILKSPTVLRMENGDMWGWEGCFPDAGCCHGSCTHVWNYAQAFPHLYPQLERTSARTGIGPLDGRERPRHFPLCASRGPGQTRLPCRCGRAAWAES